MKKKILELEDNIKKQEEGIKILVEENTQLRNQMDSVVEQAEGAQEDWEPQIRWRDERYEAMMKEHEQVKQILMEEMLKAQEACKQIEEQVRRFPNPFEAELEELKDRYAPLLCLRNVVFFAFEKIRTSRPVRYTLKTWYVF